MIFLRALVVWLVGLTAGILLLPNARLSDLSLALPIYGMIMTPAAILAFVVARTLEKNGVGVFAGPLVGSIVLLLYWAALRSPAKDAFALVLPIVLVTSGGWAVSYPMTSRRADFG